MLNVFSTIVLGLVGAAFLAVGVSFLQQVARRAHAAWARRNK